MKAASLALYAGMIGYAFAQPVPASEATKFKAKVIYSFCQEQNCTDGVRPVAGLIAVNGMLYGTTPNGGTGCQGQGCGTLFSVDASTGAETVLYSFAGGTDGQSPIATLIDVKGMLYGTTQLGGMNNSACDPQGCGTVFAFNLKTGKETVLYSFCSQQNCADGQKPGAALIDVKGMLYGTTQYGGVNGVAKHGGDIGCTGSDCGTVFSLDPTTGVETVLHSFAGGTDGAEPVSALINVKGTLYGTTFGDDVQSEGTVFSIDPSTGAEEVLHSFDGGADGANPLGGVIDVNGVLYGTTFLGGGTGCNGNGCGTVFSVTTSGVEKVVYGFQGGNDGEAPEAGLVNVKGTLYGTTYEGGEVGNSGLGTVFAIHAKTGTKTVVHAFQGPPDGEFPQAGLINTGDTLYGTTVLGGVGDGCGAGNDGCGTVFALTSR